MPNTTRHLPTRFIAAVLAALLLFGLAPASAALASDASQAELERELKRLEQAIGGYQRQIGSLRGQRNTLANAVARMNAERAEIDASIEATELRLRLVAADIRSVQDGITEAIARSDRTKDAVAGILRNIHRQDRAPLIASFFTEDGFTRVADDLEASRQVNNRLIESLAVLRKTSEALREQYDRLEDSRLEQERFIALQELQQQKLVETIGEQQHLISVTRGRESEYQSLLAGSSKEAAAIRNRIYELLAAERVTFGQAVAIAQWVSARTGVRAAFLLAVLTQESNLGRNVGTCNRKGDPPSKSWRVIMKPSRDHEPFKTVTSELGRNIDETPVSCPMRDKQGQQIGWGGAMGPAQFIPSTWIGYRSKVTALTGKSYADPWDIRDAFVAAGLLLKANGAGTVSGEWAAAMRYFSGGTNPAYRFYGDSVVDRAEKYQKDIEALQ